MVDTLFEQSMEIMKNIHKNYPDLRFGEVMQKAVDDFKKKPNTDFTQMSTKQIFNSLKNFEEKTKNQRRNKHDNSKKVVGRRSGQ